MNGHGLGAARGQRISRAPIAQDIPLTAEIVVRRLGEDVGQLVRQSLPDELSRQQSDPLSLSTPRRLANRASAEKVVAVVDHDADDTLRQIESRLDLVENDPGVVEIVAVRMLPIHAVNDRIALVVGLDAERFCRCP